MNKLRTGSTRRVARARLAGAVQIAAAISLGLMLTVIATTEAAARPPDEGNGDDRQVFGQRKYGDWSEAGTSTGPGGAPMGDLIIILQWLTWGGIVICLASFIIAAGRIGVAIRSGEEIDGLRGIVLTCAAALVIGGALGLVTTVLN